MNRYLAIPLLLSVFTFSFVAFKLATKAEAQNKTSEKTPETDANEKADLHDHESAIDFVKEKFALRNPSRILTRTAISYPELQAVQFDSIKQSESLTQSAPLLGSITLVKQKVTHKFPIFVDRATREIYVQAESGWVSVAHWNANASFDFHAKKTDRPQDLSWGKEDASGLQMGCWFDSDRQTVWCVIHNKGDRSIRYSDYLLGWWEFVILKARSKDTGKWHVVDRKKDFSRIHKSAGASAKNIHILPPEKDMPPPYNENETVIPLAAEPVYTFGVRLKDFEWPEDLRDNVTVVISQPLGGDASKDTWKGTLQSGHALIGRIVNETKSSQQKNPPDKK